jgi:hypothetical protein
MQFYSGPLMHFLSGVDIRPLEKKAVATPGSIYFTYWRYLGHPAGRVAHLVKHLLALIKDYS